MSLKKVSRSYRSSYNKLLEYCERYHWEVKEVANETSSIDSPHATITKEDNIIVINSNYSSEAKLYVLLHEIGHILTATSKGYSARYSAKIRKMDSDEIVKSNFHKIEQIQEELESWNRGFDLAKQMGIYISKKRFDYYKAKNVMTYIKYYWQS